MSVMPSCYNHSMRKARKTHKCCECGGAIQAGEEYHYHSGIWDGTAASYKVCVDCEELRYECDQDVRDDEERTAFGCLSYSIDDMSCDALELLMKFIEIKRKRGATIPSWAEKRINA